MDKPPQSERRWAPGSPQALLVGELVDHDDWRRSTGVLATYGPSQQTSGDRLLRSVVNWYYASVADEHLARRLEAPLRAIVGGSFSQIDAALGLAPDPDHATSRALVQGIVQAARGLLGDLQVRPTMGAVRGIFETATFELLDTVDLQAEQLANRLLGIIGEGDARPKRHERQAVLARHISGSPAALPYAAQTAMLSSTLERLSSGYASWVRERGIPPDAVDEHITLLFSRQRGFYTCMRELMAASDDPAAMHRTILGRLEEFLASPAPSRAVFARRGRAATAHVRPEEPGAELREFIDSLRLPRVVTGLLMIGAATEQESLAARAHIFAGTSLPEDRALLAGLASIRRLIDEHRPQGGPEDETAHILMNLVLGSGTGPPLPLDMVIRTEGASTAERQDLAVRFGGLCRDALYTAMARRPELISAMLEVLK